VRALSERPFRLLWLGQTTSAIGDVMVGVALAFAVFEIGGGRRPARPRARVLTIGRTAFVLVGGVWADRLPRRLVMLTCDAIRALVQAFVAVALLAGAAEIWMLAVPRSCSARRARSSCRLRPALSRRRSRPADCSRRTRYSQFRGARCRSSGPAVSGLIVAAAEPGWSLPLTP
jgi:hypothetical protein